MSTSFIGIWNTIQQDVHETAKKSGFWDYGIAVPSKTILAEKICLIHSELSEGLEALRSDPDGNGNLGEELADVVIRVMDLAEKYHLRVAEELIQKMILNKTREFKHGKEF